MWFRPCVRVYGAFAINQDSRCFKWIFSEMKLFRTKRENKKRRKRKIVAKDTENVYYCSLSVCITVFPFDADSRALAALVACNALCVYFCGFIAAPMIISERVRINVARSTIKVSTLWFMWAIRSARTKCTFANQRECFFAAVAATLCSVTHLINIKQLLGPANK